MHHVTRFRSEALAVPPVFAKHSRGFSRDWHIDDRVGSVHTSFGTSRLDAGGVVSAHAHSLEEFFYVVEGHPVLEVDGGAYTLSPDDCGFIPVGSVHSWRNDSPDAALWIDFETPIERPGRTPADTFFFESQPAVKAKPVDVRDPRTQRFFSWHQSQMDVDLLKRPKPADAPEVSSSMSSALLAYSGIAVKMLIDERHGAYLGNLFMVDYQPDVVLHPHDHPVEEAFYMLEGEVVFIADDQEYTLRVGDVAWAGVGCIHAFENRSGVRTRWLETRAPLPPLHHAYRFNRDWDYLSTLSSQASGR